MSLSQTKATTQRLLGIICPKRAAAICDKTEMTISRWQDDDKPQYTIPLHFLKLIDAECDDIALKEWADERGYDLVRREPCNQRQEESALRAVAELVECVAELNLESVDCLSDGHKSETDERRMRDKLRRVKDAGMRFEKAIA